MEASVFRTCDHGSKHGRQEEPPSIRGFFFWRRGGHGQRISTVPSRAPRVTRPYGTIAPRDRAEPGNGSGETKSDPHLSETGPCLATIPRNLMQGRVRDALIALDREHPVASFLRVLIWRADRRGPTPSRYTHRTRSLDRPWFGESGSTPMAQQEHRGALNRGREQLDPLLNIRGQPLQKFFGRGGRIKVIYQPPGLAAGPHRRHPLERPQVHEVVHNPRVRINPLVPRQNTPHPLCRGLRKSFAADSKRPPRAWVMPMKKWGDHESSRTVGPRRSRICTRLRKEATSSSAGVSPYSFASAPNERIRVIFYLSRKAHRGPTTGASIAFCTVDNLRRSVGGKTFRAQRGRQDETRRDQNRGGSRSYSDTD